MCIDSRSSTSSGSGSGCIPTQGMSHQWCYISIQAHYIACSRRTKGNRSAYCWRSGRSVEQVHYQRCFLTRALTCSLQRIEIRVASIYIISIRLQVPLVINTCKYPYITTTYHTLKIRYFRRFTWHSAHLKGFSCSGSNVRVLNKHQRHLSTTTFTCFLRTEIDRRIPIYKVSNRFHCSTSTFVYLHIGIAIGSLQFIYKFAYSYLLTYSNRVRIYFCSCRHCWHY